MSCHKTERRNQIHEPLPCLLLEDAMREQQREVRESQTRSQNQHMRMCGGMQPEMKGASREQKMMKETVVMRDRKTAF